MKKILFLVNHDFTIYNYRLELVKRLLKDKYKVYVSSPYGEKIEILKELGCEYVETNINRHGMNPFEDLQLLKFYKKIIKEIKPDYIFAYTIKPNIYGAIAARKNNVPFIANITGLGMGFDNSGVKQKLLINMYRYAFKSVQRVFVQNKENMQLFKDNGIAIDKLDLLPGSGVNLKRFSYSKYPDDKKVCFAFTSRIMKEKGIDNYLETAKIIKKKYPNTEFHVCGYCEENYEGHLKKLHRNGDIIYHGMIYNMNEFLENIHCVVHPTYYSEGLSNVLLEACAVGRPIITTDRAGCREVVDNKKNGFIVKPKDTADLVEKIERFIKLDNNKKMVMGKNARKKVEKQFDRNIVINKYMEEIKEKIAI